MYGASTDILLFSTVAFLSTKRVLWKIAVHCTSFPSNTTRSIQAASLVENKKLRAVPPRLIYLYKSHRYSEHKLTFLGSGQGQGRYVLGFCFQGSGGGQTHGPNRSYLALKHETARRDAMPLAPLADGTFGWQAACDEGTQTLTMRAKKPSFSDASAFKLPFCIV